MSNWFQKKCFANSDKDRIEKNISRLEDLRLKIHELGYFVFSSNSGGHEILKNLLGDQLVKGRPVIWKKLNQAYIGENNQKIALDSPAGFQFTMIEAEKLIMNEINKEKRDLRELAHAAEKDR